MEAPHWELHCEERAWASLKLLQRLEKTEWLDCKYVMSQDFTGKYVAPYERKPSATRWPNETGLRLLIKMCCGAQNSYMFGGNDVIRWYQSCCPLLTHSWPKASWTPMVDQPALWNCVDSILKTCFTMLLKVSSLPAELLGIKAAKIWWRESDDVESRPEIGTSQIKIDEWRVLPRPAVGEFGIQEVLGSSPINKYQLVMEITFKWMISVC